MTVRELIQGARNTTQDQEKVFWDDSEMLSYYQEARRVLASERIEKQTTQTILLDGNSSTYNPDGVLRYISAVDDLGNERPFYPDDGSGESDIKGIVVVDYNEVFVNDPELGTSIYISVISIPAEQNLNDDVRQGDESALKYYILSKCYEKETDMENFAKAQQFEGSYRKALVKLKQNTSVGYSQQRVRTIKGYYF